LSDAPTAFSRTHAEESALPISHWVNRAEAGSSGALSATFVAVDSDAWVGLAGGFRSTEQVAYIELVSMWVAPDARGTDAAAALVQAVLDWAAEIGVAEVQLWVMDDNRRAISLYKSAGFEVLVDFEASPGDPCENETRMRRLV